MSAKTVMKSLGLAAAAVLVSGAAWAYPAQVSRDLNLRTGPGTNYQVVATMPGGAVVDVEGCRSGWCRVEYRGREGWASARYLGEVRVGRSPAHRPPAVVYRAPPPVYAQPAPGLTLQFGFGPRYEERYEERYVPHKPRRAWREERRHRDYRHDRRYYRDYYYR